MVDGDTLLSSPYLVSLVPTMASTKVVNYDLSAFADADLTNWRRLMLQTGTHRYNRRG